MEKYLGNTNQRLRIIITILAHASVASWNTFLNKNQQHPCNVNGSKCCHFWTSYLQHDLKPIMKVMRMATGRGQSHFNVTDFLQPFIQNVNKLRYPLNFNSTDPSSKFSSGYSLYNGIEKNPEIRDRTSFIPACTYACRKFTIGKSCKLFEPVITDLGICYSFNAEPVKNMLRKSSFTEAFHEAYQYDLTEDVSHKAKGAGDNFALRFMVHNSRSDLISPRLVILNLIAMWHF